MKLLTKLFFVLLSITVNSFASAQDQIYFDVVSATKPEEVSIEVFQSHKNIICVKTQDLFTAIDDYTYETTFKALEAEIVTPIFRYTPEIKFAFYIDDNGHKDVINKIKSKKKSQVCLKVYSFPQEFYKKTSWFLETLDYTLYYITEIDLI